MILRGTNGSGKSRALEMLLPFLLDADRRRMDATGAARVSLDELMRTGAQGQSNRIGYLWLELARPGEYLTVGALVRHSQSASNTKVWYFTTPLRVGEGLPLMSASREPLSRDALTELIGAERITESAHAHRDHVRTLVFGLHGDAGRDRYDGLLQLLHTLRAPDVGNRIDEGRLPQILLESLPPLQEDALSRAGEQLDGLTETRLAQQRLEDSARQVDKLPRRLPALRRRHAALPGPGDDGRRRGRDRGRGRATQRAKRAGRPGGRAEQREAAVQQLAEERSEIDAALRAIEKREIFKTADDLVQRDQKPSPSWPFGRPGAGRGRAEPGQHGQRGRRRRAGPGRTAGVAGDAAAALAGDPGRARRRGAARRRACPRRSAWWSTWRPGSALLRTSATVTRSRCTRPAAAQADVIPVDLAAAQEWPGRGGGAAERLGLAQRRLARGAAAGSRPNSRCCSVEAEAGQLRDAAEEDARDGGRPRGERDTAAVALAQAWRAWCRDTADHRTAGRDRLGRAIRGSAR